MKGSLRSNRFSQFCRQSWGGLKIVARLRDSKLRKKASKSSKSSKSKSAKSSRQPLVPRRHWEHLPGWIALYAERGPLRKCYAGHRLLWTQKDGRRHGACHRCKQTPGSGEAIMICRQCPNWTMCRECCSSKKSRLPMLSEDPLFHGPSSPCLLAPFFSGSTEAPARGQGTVIICPGGNYEFLCPLEGLPVAQFLARRGITALVLRYRLLPKFSLKDALADLEHAVALVRRTRGGPVAAMGFSAGGHLVASVALRLARETRWSRRPLDAQVLVYPAIDGIDWLNPDKAGFCQDGSFEHGPELQADREALLGGPGFAAPPTFLVASTGDGCCSPEEHSDPYAAALKRKRIPHVYVRRNFGDHGFGADGGWMTSCSSWLQRRGFGTCSSFAGA